MKIKMLKAEKRYGLKKGDVLEVELLSQERRYAIFLEPPIRQLSLYNEDWENYEQHAGLRAERTAANRS